MMIYYGGGFGHSCADNWYFTTWLILNKTMLKLYTVVRGSDVNIAS
jgi:hypothetical protein